MSTEHQSGSTPASIKAEDAADGSAEDAATSAPKDGFTFTQPGCRTEIRLGTLLVLASVFLWLWLGPSTSSLLYFVGLPMILVGVPIQAWQGRRFGRPGYPLRLGLVLTVGGLAMLPGIRYREMVGDSLHFQPIGPMIIVAGVWMLAWWPWSRRGASPVANTAAEVAA